jgi:GT2 family glycosyltransferase
MSNKQPPLLSIVTVNYRSKKALTECLYSFVGILQKEAISFEWIVINNSKEEQVFYKHPNVYFFAQKENVGFGKACNRGVKRARGEILWFLNPDTVYEKGSIKKSLEALRQPAIIGHHLLNKKRQEQVWTYGKELTIGRLFLQNVFPSKTFLFCRKEGLCAVDWVSGASFMIRREDFLFLGGFDERFFMYFEDMDLCVRARETLPVYRDNSLTLLHKGGQSFLSCTKIQKMLYYVSMEEYIKKHFPLWQSRYLCILLRMKLCKKSK